MKPLGEVKRFNHFVWLFVIPFVLAHVIFWPSMFLLFNVFSGDYGINAALSALGLSCLLGGAYGAYVGTLAASASSSGGAGTVVLYCIAQMVWFPVSVVSPCALLLFGISA